MVRYKEDIWRVRHGMASRSYSQHEQRLTTNPSNGNQHEQRLKTNPSNSNQHEHHLMANPTSSNQHEHRLITNLSSGNQYEQRVMANLSSGTQNDLTANKMEYFTLPNETISQGELFSNGTSVQIASHTTRAVHMQPRLSDGGSQHFGTFYTEYDPMTGARTAAILGSFLLMLVFYIIYKAKCHKPWTDEDDFYLQQYKRRCQDKLLQQSGRRPTSFIIDPVCHPDPSVLAATAQWVKNQPLDSAFPEGLPVERRRSRYALSKFPSISAENINRHYLHGPPLIPNGHVPDFPGPINMANEFVPNGILKNVNKGGTRSNVDLPDSRLGLVLDTYTPPQSSHFLTVHGQKYDAIEMLQLPTPDPNQGQGCRCDFGPNHDSDMDQRRQRFQPTVSMEVNVETCTKCNASHGCTCNNMTFDLGSSLVLPHNPDLTWTPKSKRSIRQSQSSSRRPSSHDDEHMETSLSLSPVSRSELHMNLDLSILEPPLFTLDLEPSEMPVLSIIDNLASNANVSPQSTVMGSSAGSYTSDSTNIPLTDFSSKIPHVTIYPQPVKNAVDIPRDEAHKSSSKISSERVTSL